MCGREVKTCAPRRELCCPLERFGSEHAWRANLHREHDLKIREPRAKSKHGYASVFAVA